MGFSFRSDALQFLDFCMGTDMPRHSENGQTLDNMRAFPEIDGVDFLGGDTQAREMIKYLLGNRFAVFIRIRHPPIRLEEILRFQIHIVRNFCFLFLLQLFIGTRRLFRLLHSLIIP